MAILSRVGLDDVDRGFPASPAFRDPEPPRPVVSATCAGLRVIGVRAQRPRRRTTRTIVYKLAWLKALAGAVPPGPADTVVCGDMNIAPTDADVCDPEVRRLDPRHPAERAALGELEATGLADVVRLRWPTQRVFTYWDYRAGAFHQDLGMRIDLVLAGSACAAAQAAWVDRQARKGSGPSDHAPVIVDLDEAPDGDIGPVVPPPSAPRRSG